MEDQKPGGYDEWKKIKWVVIVKKMVRQGAPFFYDFMFGKWKFNFFCINRHLIVRYCWVCLTWYFLAKQCRCLVQNSQFLLSYEVYINY